MPMSAKKLGERYAQAVRRAKSQKKTIRDLQAWVEILKARLERTRAENRWLDNRIAERDQRIENLKSDLAAKEPPKFYFGPALRYLLIGGLVHAIITKL